MSTHERGKLWTMHHQDCAWACMASCKLTLILHAPLEFDHDLLSSELRQKRLGVHRLQSLLGWGKRQGGTGRSAAQRHAQHREDAGAGQNGLEG